MVDISAVPHTSKPRSMLIPSRSYLPDPGPSYWVSLRYFSLSRLVVVSLLLLTLLLSGGIGEFRATGPEVFQRTVITYGIFGLMFSYLAITRQERFYLQLVGQLILDLTAITFLMHASGGVRGGIAVLYLLPIAGAAIMSPLLLAAGFAAASTITILGETLVRNIAGDQNSASTLEAGLYGIACFAIALVINRLAARLIAQQEIAQRRGLDLERQIEINRLVVADMQDGVLILAEDGSPSALNPSAARMLRVAHPEILVRQGWRDHAAGHQIHDHFLAWMRSPSTASETFELTVGSESEEGTGIGSERLRARFVSAQRNQATAGHVVFLEDLQRVDERAQQLKLASMGRLTASIAHEIRNPLAAISHASALLSEGISEKPERRLLSIVQDNTRRLDRIVENILQLSRRGPVQADEVELEPFLSEIIAEFCRDQGFSPLSVDVSIYARPMLYFNRDHLRQVVMNLLQNAARHATGGDASVSLVVVPVVPTDARALRQRAMVPPRNVDRIELIVQDDGVGIDAQTRLHLFEPFFTTHHRGTGLGLYLARELCLANGATLGYVPNADVNKKGGFVINAAGWLDEAHEESRIKVLKTDRITDE
jgi:two-component system sensor histidine kinase PilS (NtrC family)